ncbi:hypothetical protein BavelB3_19810 [Bacillus velezensis]
MIKLLGLLLFGMGSPLSIHICMFNIPQSSKIIHTLNFVNHTQVIKKENGLRLYFQG